MINICWTFYKERNWITMSSDSIINIRNLNQNSIQSCAQPVRMLVLVRVVNKSRNIQRARFRHKKQREKYIYCDLQRKEKIKRPTKKIEKKDVKVVKYRGQKMELKPLSIDLQVTQSKNIPFEGLELQRIKNSFMKEDKILYEVQFKDDPLKEAIIINDKYLKLLWPRKYAEFLLGKISNNNGKT